MSEIKNTYTKFELNDGSEVDLTLTFGKLNMLKSVNHELYQKFNSVVYGKSEDMMDIVAVVYIAYWCANYKVGQEIYSEQEFIDLVPFDMNKLKEVFTSLTQPKKK